MAGSGDRSLRIAAELGDACNLRTKDAFEDRLATFEKQRDRTGCDVSGHRPRPSVNTLVDLTEATTATSVVQTRGRALRLDPDWPEKTAHTWSVVCVAPNHPRGSVDWDRFVRKHDAYFALTDSGDVMAGVAHVDAELSPYAPPLGGEFDRINARMLHRV